MKGLSHVYPVFVDMVKQCQIDGDVCFVDYTSKEQQNVKKSVEEVAR